MSHGDAPASRCTLPARLAVALCVACVLVRHAASTAELPDYNSYWTHSWNLVHNVSDEAVLREMRSRLDTPMYERCAVVSSSAGMLGSGHGPAIDAHDAVIRVNFPKVKGFEADVGSKTTVVYSSLTVAVKNIKQVYFRNDFPGATVILKNPCDNTPELHHNESKCRAAENRYFDRCLDKMKTTHWRECRVESRRAVMFRMASWNSFGPVQGRGGMSSGWVAIHTAQELCREITLYGFGSFVSGHYWWLRHRDASRKHAFRAERRRIVAVAQRHGNMTLAPSRSVNATSVHLHLRPAHQVA